MYKLRQSLIICTNLKYFVPQPFCNVQIYNRLIVHFTHRYWPGLDDTTRNHCLPLCSGLWSAAIYRGYHISLRTKMANRCSKYCTCMCLFCSSMCSSCVKTKFNVYSTPFFLYPGHWCILGISMQPAESQRQTHLSYASN